MRPLGHLIAPWNVSSFLGGSEIGELVHATGPRGFLGILKNGPELRPSVWGPAFFTAPRHSDLTAYGALRVRIALRSEHPFVKARYANGDPEQGGLDLWRSITMRLSGHPISPAWKVENNEQLGEGLTRHGYDSVITTHHIDSPAVVAIRGSQMRVVVTPALMAVATFGITLPVASAWMGYHWLRAS